MKSFRPRTLLRSTGLRSAGLVIAALALTACAGVHPGSAAVVDGVSISMDKADKASTAYCKLALSVAAQQGVTSVSAADTRRQSITDLVTFAVAKKIARQQDLQLDPNTFVITAAQKTQIAKAFPGAGQTQINDAIERSQETYAIIVALGEKTTGTTISDSNKAEVEAAGQAEIHNAYKSSDISIDPRFGLNDLTKQIAATGSLSIAEVTEADIDPAKLPAAQRCS